MSALFKAASRNFLQPTSISKLLAISGAKCGMAVFNLSDEEAVEKFHSIHSKSVLYFTASWCGPCRAIAPIYEQISKDHPNIAFGKVDVDENNDAALEFKINAVPTFVLFDGETTIDKFAGADQNKLLTQVKALDAR